MGGRVRGHKMFIYYPYFSQYGTGRALHMEMAHFKAIAFYNAKFWILGVAASGAKFLGPSCDIVLHMFARALKFHNI